MVLPVDENRCAFWKLWGGGTPDITNANLPGISRQAVSRAIPVMDGRMSGMLLTWRME